MVDVPGGADNDGLHGGQYSSAGLRSARWVEGTPVRLGINPGGEDPLLY
jgi:hypothetical protein